MSEWKEYRIGDIGNFSYGKMPKKDKLNTGDYPTFSGYKYQFTYPEYNCKKNDLIVVARGVGGTGDVKVVKEDCYLTNLSLKMDFDTNIVDKTFVFYYYFKDTLRYLDSGSAQSQITINDLSDAFISLPPLKEQKAIAEVLSSLDDKIDLLHRQNRTLEEMAQTLFRQWFIEEAKDEWREYKLGDILEIKYGKDHKNLDDGNIPVYGSGGIMRYANSFLYDKESILIPRKGTLTNLFYIDEPFWTVDTLFWSKVNIKKVSVKFIFSFLKTMDLSNLNVGSAVPSLTTKVLNEILISLPSLEEQKEFNEYADNAWNKIKSNNIQIKTLENTRDTLLSKLMSGEVRIKDE